MSSIIKPLVVLVLLIASLASTSLMLWLKTVFDFLGPGYSSTVTVLPLVLLLIVFASERLPSRWDESWNPALPVGLLLLNAVCLLQRFLFCRANGLPLAQTQTVIRDGRPVVTSLSDIQEGQALLAWLSGGNLDPGFQFLPYLPTWLLGLHGLLLLAVTVIALLTIHRFQETHSFGSTLCLTLSVYTLLRSGWDGGPFSPPALVAVTFLVGTLFPKRAALGLAGSVLGLLLIIGLSGSGSLGLLISKAIGAMLVLLIPLVWKYGRESESKVWMAAAVACLLFVVALPWLQMKVAPKLARPPFTQGTIVYSQRTLLPGGIFVILGPPGLKQPDNGVLTFVDTLKGQNLVTYRAKLLKKSGIKELCELFELDLTKRPIIWKLEPAYVRMTGKFPKPFPRPESEMLLGYKLEEKDGLSTLHMTLQGGGGVDAAFDALPKGSAVITGYEYSTNPPTGYQGWTPGAGYGKWSNPDKGQQSKPGSKPGSKPKLPGPKSPKAKSK